jgi:lectin-like protein
VRHTWWGLLALGACSFDQSGLGSGAADESSGSSTGALSTTTTSETTKGSSDETSTSAAETSTETSTTEASSTDTTTGTGDEICNTIDDDGDGAVDEFSPSNQSCNGCVYVPVGDGISVWSFCADLVTWGNAQARCKLLGGDLASIHSAAENGEVFAGAAGNRVWIGMNDQAEEDAWGWSDGSAVDYTAWDANQPNDNNELGEDCAVMEDFNSVWNDNYCDELRALVCRAPA